VIFFKQIIGVFSLRRVSSYYMSIPRMNEFVTKGIVNLSLMPPPKRPRQDITTVEQISQGSSYQTTVTDLLSQGYAPQIAHLMATAAAEHLVQHFLASQ